MTFEGKHSDITGKIIGAFFAVYNQLGYGFSEKVYENALAIELRKLGLDVQQQAPIKVFFDGHSVGEYFVDILVNQLVIVELKSVKTISEDHEAQLLNYLKATWIEVGLLLNFGPQVQHIRKTFDNERKGNMSWTHTT
jgi:GxxExxY protein